MALEIEFPYEIPGLVDLLRELVLTNNVLRGLIYLPEFRDVADAEEILLPAMLIDGSAIDCCRDDGRVAIIYPRHPRWVERSWVAEGDELLDSVICGYPSVDNAVVALRFPLFSFVIRRGDRVVLGINACNDDCDDRSDDFRYCYNVVEIDASTSQVKRVSRIDAVLVRRDAPDFPVYYFGCPPDNVLNVFDRYVMNRYYWWRRVLMVHLPYSDPDTVHIVAYDGSRLVTERIQVEEEDEDQDQV